MAREYDLVILGGGTGGYVAAIRASQLGLKTAIVEKEHLGGTCLHHGCIPTKTLLRSAEVYQQTKKSNLFGVEVSDIHLNFSVVQQRKQTIINQLHNGINHLMKKGKIDIYYGNGRILGPSIFSPLPGSISVEMKDGSDNEILLPKNVIIATGSKSRTLDGMPFDGEYILSSNEVLQMETLPKSIVIVGGGVIGIEWASLLCDFGVNVTILEYGDRILPTEDQDISNEIEKALTKRGVNIFKQATILPESKRIVEHGVQISAIIDEEETHFEVEKILISIGRSGNIEDIGLDNTEIEVEQSFIKVNNVYQTKEKHIYAIGDVIGGLQLAHVAAHEGIAAVEHMKGLTNLPIQYDQIARCVYSQPEVATIGLSEQQAKQLEKDIEVAKFPFSAIGKALIYGEKDGFIKIIKERGTDDILGIHMIGPHVTDMISEAALGMLLDATPWEIGKVIHPHPSLSEVMGEAALAVEGRAIHF